MRRFLPAALLVALALVPATAGQAASSSSKPACDKATVGRLANARGGVYDPKLGFTRFICHDFTRDGRADAAFAIASGGSSGSLGWGIARELPDGSVKLAHFESKAISVGVKRHRRDVLVSSPIYGPNDPNCCPSGFHIATWHWNGHRFKRTHTRRVHKLHGFY